MGVMVGGIKVPPPKSKRGKKNKCDVQVDRGQKSVREFFKSDEFNLGPNQGQDEMNGGMHEFFNS